MSLIYYTIWVLFGLLLALIVLAFTAALNVKLILDSDLDRSNLTVAWLNPFFRVTAELQYGIPVLTCYLFHRKVYARQIKSLSGQHKNGRKRKGNIAGHIHHSHVNVSTSYGFKDPFSTGITYGLLNIVTQYLPVLSFSQHPDFLSGRDYVHVDATAKVYVGKTLLDLTKTKFNIH